MSAFFAWAMRRAQDQADATRRAQRLEPPRPLTMPVKFREMPPEWVRDLEPWEPDAVQHRERE